jgi:predicted RNase H-like HicB family nuclease
MKYRISIEQDEDEIYVAECPTLSGYISERKTREESFVNIRGAITGYLEILRKHDGPIPRSIEEEIVEVSL